MPNGVVTAALLLALGAAFITCTPPIRQFDLNNQPLTCDQANDYSLRTLQGMGFSITAFEPARVGRQGTLRGTREEEGTQNVTVAITCNAKSVDIDATEDGKFLGRLEFRRGFYLSFTATVSQMTVLDAEARAAALRPPEERKGSGLRVLLEPVRGMAAKLDFDIDLAAAGVLPVRVTMINSTARTYRFDPTDIALVQPDGARVRPLSVNEAVQRIAAAPRPPESAPPDSGALMRQLQGRAVAGNRVSADQTVKGYLFFPLAQYVKGRVSLEDEATEESEGVVVEF